MKSKKMIIYAALLAAVLSLSAAGCRGAADNSSAPATAVQNSTATPAEEDSNISAPQTIDFTSTDVYKMIEPLKDKAAVKMTVKTNYKYDEGDVELESVNYYFNTKRVEASSDKSGIETAVIYDCETQKIYAANLTKKK